MIGPTTAYFLPQRRIENTQMSSPQLQTYPLKKGLYCALHVVKNKNLC